MHGCLGDKSWASPQLVTYCAQEARPGYLTCQAHEYVEVSPDVLKAKIKLLAILVKKSKFTIVYTGAGISTASGIPDYATKAADGLIKKSLPKSSRSSLLASPTLSHRILVELYKAGFIKGWINQNHDGLPQKAGFPQESINGKLRLVFS